MLALSFVDYCPGSLYDQTQSHKKCNDQDEIHPAKYSGYKNARPDCKVAHSGRQGHEYPYADYRSRSQVRLSIKSRHFEDR